MFKLRILPIRSAFSLIQAQINPKWHTNTDNLKNEKQPLQTRTQKLSMDLLEVSQLHLVDLAPFFLSPYFDILCSS